MTFADVAAGKADARIDGQAAHLKAYYPQKLFVSIQSEMEPQIEPDAGFRPTLPRTTPPCTATS